MGDILEEDCSERINGKVLSIKCAKGGDIAHHTVEYNQPVLPRVYETFAEGFVAV